MKGQDFTRANLSKFCKRAQLQSCRKANQIEGWPQPLREASLAKSNLAREDIDPVVHERIGNLALTQITTDDNGVYEDLFSPTTPFAMKPIATQA